MHPELLRSSELAFNALEMDDVLADYLSQDVIRTYEAQNERNSNRSVIT